MTLKSLYAFFASHPEGSWIPIYQNAKLLYEFVKNHNLKKYLDLGTGIGCSAAIIALAMKEKGVTDYEIHTVEQVEKCYKLAREVIPEELRKNIKFYLSDSIIWETDLIPYQHYSIYKKLPEGNFDAWVIDGPGPYLEDDKYIELPNGDVMKMLLEDKIKPGTFIVWDGRIKALKDLERYFSGNFYLIPTEEKNDFNVLERKKNPQKFEDVKISLVGELGYFKGL